jgi:hypothetical protein
MLVALSLSFFALRAGLSMRRRRLRGQPPERGLLASHLRLARPAVVLVLTGFVGGPLSAWWLRGWTPFENFHAWLGVLAAGLFGSAGWLGLRLQRGRLSRARGANLHGLLGTLAMLAGAVAAAAGMVLLP